MPSSDLGTILHAVKSVIVAANLTGITSNVIPSKFPWRKVGVQLPVVWVCPIPEQFPQSGTNASDDTTYGVQIAIGAASNQANDLAVDNQLLEWRMKIAEAFRNKRLSGSSVTYAVTVEPGPVFDPVAHVNQMDGSTLFLRVQTRKTRT